MRVDFEGGSQSSNITEFDKKYNPGLAAASALGAQTYNQAYTGNFTPNVSVQAQQAPAQGGGGVGYNSAPAVNTGLAKKSSDAYYDSQVAGLSKARDNQLNNVRKAYDDAVAQGKMSEEEAQRAYEDAVKQINDMSYRDSQLTNIVGFDRGIQNSQQLLGLMAGDNARANQHRTDVLTERDRRLNTLKDRIALLTKQKDMDLSQINADYDYNITGARADADKMYYDYLLSASGGGGGGSRGGSTKRQSEIGNYDISKENSLINAYGEFLSSKRQSALDDYNRRMLALQQKSVIHKGVGIPYPSVANNPNLSDYEKYKMFRMDAGM